MQIKFCGAAEEVTGSHHILQTNTSQVALDAGFFQGTKQSEYKNTHPVSDPRLLDAILLSHAHMDHCGLLPYYYRSGFRGKIYCTPATYDLAELILLDIANIQELHAKNYNHYHKPKNRIHPLYTVDDVRATMELFVKKPFGEKFSVTDDIQAQFWLSGHIMGSAQILLFAEGKRILFTGDLGRPNMPIITDPDQITNADVVITESTYGDRLHDPFPDATDKLYSLVRKTFSSGGKIVIPAFALERVQEIIYLLHLGFSSGEIPHLPIYIDSPLATKITEVFQRHIEEYDHDLYEAFLKKRQDAFTFGNLKYIAGSDASAKLSQDNPEPCIIISSSGMCEAGRIVHHLQYTLPDDKNVILLVGFMAEGTLGRKLKDGEKTVNIYNEDIPVNAQIVSLDSFSAHADYAELTEYLRPITNMSELFLVHGEASAQSVFKSYLESHLSQKPTIHIPHSGESFII